MIQDWLSWSEILDQWQHHWNHHGGSKYYGGQELIFQLFHTLPNTDEHVFENNDWDAKKDVCQGKEILSKDDQIACSLWQRSRPKPHKVEKYGKPNKCNKLKYLMLQYLCLSNNIQLYILSWQCCKQVDLRPFCNVQPSHFFHKWSKELGNLWTKAGLLWTSMLLSWDIQLNPWWILDPYKSLVPLELSIDWLASH